jgi:hypothetical protein
MDKSYSFLKNRQLAEEAASDIYQKLTKNCPDLKSTFFVLIVALFNNL